jgi:PKD repeat protein
MALKRDRVELLLGIVILLVGLGLLGFTFTQALEIARAPGDFFRSQFPQTQAPRGPSASFTWDSNDLTATFQDTSRQGGAAITTWEWNFGDGTRVSAQSPSPHTYTNTSVYQVSLIIRDANGLESRAMGQVQVVPTQTRSGDSLLDPTAGLGGALDMSGLLQPVSVSALTIGMYMVMAVAGGAVTKAGWNMVKPKAETIRVRLKPSHLGQAVEDDFRPLAAYPPPPLP